jgi:predicted dehydrogenase
MSTSAPKRGGKKKKYRVAIAGCGRIASLLEDDPLRGKPATHAGAFDAHPSTKIVAGCDIDSDRLEKFGDRWGVSRLYGDYRKMLDKERVDILSVASWTEVHAEMVTYAAESGVRGIYCEKPIALNLKQAKGMIRACEKNNVALVVGHERRWDARFRIIRDMLNSGELGKLRSITGYMLSSAPPKLSRRKHGGGTMFHDGTHLVDLFNFFAGEPEYVIGLEDRPHGKGYIESTALGIINYKNGVRGMILGGGERNYFHFEIDIQTDSARILLGNHISELYRSDVSERYTGFRELKKVDFPSGMKPVNAFVGGVADLINEMETGETSISSGKDGYKALETIMAIYRSAGKGGGRVKLPL